MKKTIFALIILYFLLSYFLFKVSIVNFNQTYFDILNDNFICMKDSIFYSSNLAKAFYKKDFCAMRFEVRKIFVNNYIFLEDILKITKTKEFIF